MLGTKILRHLGEFQRYVRNFKYEQSDSGVYFPAAKATLQGIYTHWVTGWESEIAHDHNVVPDEGLNHFLGVTLKGSPSPISLWYVQLHSGTGTPDNTTDAANYDTQLSEIIATSGDPGGYTGDRPLWDADAVDTVNSEVVNDATPAAYTVVSSTTLVVNGAGLVSVATRGSGAGTLMSAGKFTAARNLVDTDVFNLKYKIDLDEV